MSIYVRVYSLYRAPNLDNEAKAQRLNVFQCPATRNKKESVFSNCKRSHQVFSRLDATVLQQIRGRRVTNVFPIPILEHVWRDPSGPKRHVWTCSRHFWKHQTRALRRLPRDHKLDPLIARDPSVDRAPICLGPGPPIRPSTNVPATLSNKAN